MSKPIIIWIMLLLLTVLSYVVSQLGFASTSAIALLAAAAMKILFVTFYFMELKKAHPVWRVSFVALTGIFMLVLLVAISRLA